MSGATLPWEQVVLSRGRYLPLKKASPKASEWACGCPGWLSGQPCLRRVSLLAPLARPALPLCCQAQTSLLKPSPAPAEPGNFQLRDCEQSWGREAGVTAAPPGRARR